MTRVLRNTEFQLALVLPAIVPNRSRLKVFAITNNIKVNVKIYLDIRYIYHINKTSFRD